MTESVHNSRPWLSVVGAGGLVGVEADVVLAVVFGVLGGVDFGVVTGVDFGVEAGLDFCVVFAADCAVVCGDDLPVDFVVDPAVAGVVFGANDPVVAAEVLGGLASVVLGAETDVLAEVLAVEDPEVDTEVDDIDAPDEPPGRSADGGDPPSVPEGPVESDNGVSDARTPVSGADFVVVEPAAPPCPVDDTPTRFVRKKIKPTSTPTASTMTTTRRTQYTRDDRGPTGCITRRR